MSDAFLGAWNASVGIAHCHALRQRFHSSQYSALKQAIAIFWFLFMGTSFRRVPNGHVLCGLQLLAIGSLHHPLRDVAVAYAPGDHVVRLIPSDSGSPHSAEHAQGARGSPKARRTFERLRSKVEVSSPELTSVSHQVYLTFENERIGKKRVKNASFSHYIFITIRGDIAHGRTDGVQVKAIASPDQNKSLSEMWQDSPANRLLREQGLGRARRQGCMV